MRKRVVFQREDRDRVKMEAERWECACECQQWEDGKGNKI